MFYIKLNSRKTNFNNKLGSYFPNHANYKDELKNSLGYLENREIRLFEQFEALKRA